MHKLALVLSIAQLIRSATGADSTAMCYEAEQDFRDLCETTYQGVAVGGQCLFVASADIKASWDDVWATCSSVGSVVAQVHSQKEYDALVAYLLQKVPSAGFEPWATLALRDDTAFNTPKDVMEETTIWYTGALSSSVTIKSGDTWIRSRSNEGGAGFGAPARCLVLFNRFAQVGDNSCVNNPRFLATCQITNLSQNFTKTNTCITENPIKTSTVQSPDECGSQCSKETWCRSFNLKTTQGSASMTCQLFTWNLFDTCKGGVSCAKTAVVDACTSYSTV